MNALRLAIERNVLYFSLGVQAALTFAVVGFCAAQLNRCPVDAPTKENADNGYADIGSCPRALYTNMITAAVAYWFPSPWYAYVSSQVEPAIKEPRRRTTKATADEVTVVEEDK